MFNRLTFLFGFSLLISPVSAQTVRSYSGIYPSLAMFNNEGECGTGAVMPWCCRLWVITYGPHKPYGSSDKLYEITSDMMQTVRSESIGGTPANRLIHRESGQMFIGPYVIDGKGNVRVIPVSAMPGRLTGMSRSYTNPADKVVYATMEEGFYEVDVNTLAVNTWFEDGNVLRRKGIISTFESPLLAGVHGKGFYMGQGVYVYSNNGDDAPRAKYDPRIESGILAEYDGKSWKQIKRCQFTEVTGPGGIEGNANPDTDPIWALGWDYKSVLLGVRTAGSGWSFYRLPKASNSYDGAHGWNTEWPRIRNVGCGSDSFYLMTMHGMFWNFPRTFSSVNTAGLRPLTSYLKVIGDFCQWNGRLVFGCDDTAKSEFLNKRSAKGGIAGPGQSQSNLWFTSLDQPYHTGTSDACGSVWQSETVESRTVSDPFLFAGWNNRTVWMKNSGSSDVKLTFEVDIDGRGTWTKAFTRKLKHGCSDMVSMEKVAGEWIRVRAEGTSQLTVSFVYGDESSRRIVDRNLFEGMSKIGDKQYSGGLIYALGDNRRTMGVLSADISNGKMTSSSYYELDENMSLKKSDSKTDAAFIQQNVSIPKNVVSSDSSSYIVIDDKKRRWRLPKNSYMYDGLMENGLMRVCREVATERDLFNCGGTFFELPAENADGYAHIRPVCTHGLQINDYASYRGLQVMTGISPDAVAGEHIIKSDDGQCAVWAGAIDDLWKLGKPVGYGGPWFNTHVDSGKYSDPYLVSHYDKKTLTMEHKSDKTVTFTMEIDPTGDGIWMSYASWKVKPGEKMTVALPRGNFARWIRFVSDTDTTVTTWLKYE